MSDVALPNSEPSSIVYSMIWSLSSMRDRAAILFAYFVSRGSRTQGRPKVQVGSRRIAAGRSRRYCATAGENCAAQPTSSLGTPLIRHARVWCSLHALASAESISSKILVALKETMRPMEVKDLIRSWPIQQANHRALVHSPRHHSVGANHSQCTRRESSSG